MERLLAMRGQPHPREGVSVDLPRKVVIATGNRKKGVEMAQILADTGLEVLTLADFPAAPQDVEETGCTYAENAILKARGACNATGLVCVADDAGLEIDALDRQPGVYSKRFLGEATSFPDKMARILELLRDVPDELRTCRFSAAVAISSPDGADTVCHGVCEGRIGRELRGEYGFGYDPVFYLPERGCTMAELPPEVKHTISHRGMALACAKGVLAELFA